MQRGRIGRLIGRLVDGDDAHGLGLFAPAGVILSAQAETGADFIFGEVCLRGVEDVDDLDKLE